eukprot:scaffold1440_cov332-Pavlova_lutheri.AAC.20
MRAGWSRLATRYAAVVAACDGIGCTWCREEGTPPEKRTYSLDEAKQSVGKTWEGMQAETGRLGQVPEPKFLKRGKQLAVRMELEQGQDLSSLVIDVIAKLAHMHDQPLEVQAYSSHVARHFTLAPRESDAEGKSMLSATVFVPLIGEGPPEIEFMTPTVFTEEDIQLMKEVCARILREKAFPQHREPRIHRNPVPRERKPPEIPEDTEEEPMFEDQAANEAKNKLEKLGAQVYYVKSTTEGKDIWEQLAGYDEQKREIEDTVLLSLTRPDVYEKIARGTRKKYESNRPRAILFEGPPGTGKTTSARAIAGQAFVPLVYIPLEALGSKFYGEAEKQLSEALKSAETIGKSSQGCLLFLDEIDSLATSRSSELHEVTRRQLGVLLRHLDGFVKDKRSVVIAATNRKEDLDPALTSRFDSIVHFGLPDEVTRSKILVSFARQLNEEEIRRLAGLTEGMSGRDLRDLCENAERRWASKVIRGMVTEGTLPSAAEYEESAVQRRASAPGSGAHFRK